MAAPTALTGIRDLLRGRARRDRYAWALITPSVLLALSLATYVVAGRLLDPDEFGRFAVAIAVLTAVAPFISLGTPVILVRHLAGEGERASISAARPAAYLAVLVASVLIVALAGLLDLVPGHVLSRWLSPGLAPVVAVGAAASALVDLRVAEDQASFRFQRQLGGLAAASLIRLAGLSLAMAFAAAPDHRAAIAGYVAGSLVAALYMARSGLVLALQRAGEALSFIRHDLARIGVPITSSTMLAGVTTQIDTLIATAFLAPAHVAQYAVANRLSLIHATAVGGVTAIALPVAASLAKQDALARYARITTRLGLLLGAGAVAISILLAPLAVRVLFGVVYQPAVMLFAILSIGFWLNYPGNPLSQVLYMTHRGYIMVAIQVLQLACFAVLALYVTPRWGATGLATARSATNLTAVAIVSVVAMVVAARGSSRVEPADA